MTTPRPPATLSERVFTVRRWLVRHRRWAAVGLAFLSVLCVVQVMAPGTPAATTSATRANVALDDDLVQFPLRLADADVAALLAPGDVIDVIGSEIRGATSMVAESLTVVGVEPPSDSSFGGGDDGLVLVAVTSAVAVDLAAAGARGPLTVALHPQSASQ